MKRKLIFILAMMLAACLCLTACQSNSSAPEAASAPATAPEATEAPAAAPPGHRGPRSAC